MFVVETTVAEVETRRVAETRFSEFLLVVLLSAAWLDRVETTALGATRVVLSLAAQARFGTPQHNRHNFIS